MKTWQQGSCTLMEEVTSEIPYKRPSIDMENGINFKNKREKLDHEDIASCTKNKFKESPRLSVALFRDNCVIQHKDIHDLLKYACLGKVESQTSWCRIHHQDSLRSVAIIVLQGLSKLHFYRFYLHFQHLRKLFKHRFTMPPSPSDFIASLVGTSPDRPGSSCAISRTDPIILKYGNEHPGLTRYLLTQKEMKENDYPVVGSDDAINYVNTGCSGLVTDDSPLFGLDCEMCVTDQGYELTRISLVDAGGNCILNQLVKPDNHIRDYMTRFSGVTKKMLLPVKLKLKDVQHMLKTLLPADAILVGHSLCNDLKALKMIHPNVIDTALLFARLNNRKFRLKFLAKSVLGREIQNGEVNGHCPAEDAKAALNLAQYFIHHGPQKVAQLNLEKVQWNMNSQNGPLEAEQPHSLLESLNASGKKIVYISKSNGQKAPTTSSAYDCVWCSSDEEVLGKACPLDPPASVNVINFSPSKLESLNSVVMTST
ncbi:hypothetical protein GDO86_017406, partial [Hymenochirus boettgeri]